MVVVVVVATAVVTAIGQVLHLLFFLVLLESVLNQIRTDGSHGSSSHTGQLASTGLVRGETSSTASNQGGSDTTLTLWALGAGRTATGVLLLVAGLAAVLLLAVGSLLLVLAVLGLLAVGRGAAVVVVLLLLAVLLLAVLLLRGVALVVLLLLAAVLRLLPSCVSSKSFTTTMYQYIIRLD